MPRAGAQLALFTVLQFGIPCLGDGATHTGLGVQISVNILKIIPHKHAHRPTWFRQLSETSLLQVFLDCVKLVKPTIVLLP